MRCSSRISDRRRTASALCSYVVLLIPFAFIAFSANAQTQSRPASYAEALERFNSYSTLEKLSLQLLLSAEGSWPAVPNRDFSVRLFSAIAQFQKSQGFHPDGALPPDQVRRLNGLTRPYFERWGLVEVFHPVRPHSVWVPRRILDQESRTKTGFDYRSSTRHLQMSFDYLQLDLESLYQALSPDTDQRKTEYKVVRKDFFVLVRSHPNGNRSYLRFHKDGSGVIGFHLVWSATDTFTRGDQLVTLISSQIYSRMTYSASLPLPNVGAPPAPVEVSRSSPPATPHAYTPPKPPKAASSGSGFFVSDAGHILTNAHVIEDCTDIDVTPDAQPTRRARLIASDRMNDLAIVQAEGAPPLALTFGNAAPRLGETVAAFGFPLSSVLTRNGNFTLGHVTALAGISDDSRYLQISAPVQSGNSGGPLLDNNGNIAGVVTAKLNALRTALATGDLPQNVNFAIKASQARSFLEASRVPVQTTEGKQHTTVELAERARQASVFIYCR